MAAITFSTAHQAEQPEARPHTTVPAKFRPLDPGIVNEAISAFFIGRNAEGFWVARDGNGQIGGIFLLESSALSFARRHSRPAGCAAIYPSGRIELDLVNSGNALIGKLGSLLRLSRRPGRRSAGWVGKMAAAIGRQRMACSSVRRTTAGTEVAAARLARIKRFCSRAALMLLTVGALAGILGLKTVIYVWRFEHF
jgi:hypothetical protein